MIERKKKTYRTRFTDVEERVPALHSDVDGELRHRVGLIGGVRRGDDQEREEDDEAETDEEQYARDKLCNARLWCTDAPLGIGTKGLETALGVVQFSVDVLDLLG